MEKLVSIIVPAYNTEQYIEKCLNSLLMQTYQHFEVLLIDDGSNDATTEICQGFANKDSRIRFFQQTHAGVSCARNRGLLEMNGEYLAFLDSDDWLEPEALQSLITKAEENDADIVFFNMTYEEEGKSYLRVENPKDGLVNRREMIKQTLLSQDQWHNRYGYFLNIVNKLFRVDKLQKEAGKVYAFDSHVSVLEDGLWLMKHLPFMEKAMLIPHGYYHRIIRQDSTTGSNATWFDYSLRYLQSYKQILTMIRSMQDPMLTRITLNSFYGTIWNTFRHEGIFRKKLIFASFLQSMRL